MNDNDILKPLLGHTVEVRSRGGEQGFRDDGVLVAYDDRWVQLQKNNGEVLFFPISNIRLLKPLN